MINYMNGEPLGANDWDATFNNGICVGSRQWDISQCNSGVCEVPAMGDDGYYYSFGYLNNGDFPDFKIYDSSEGIYYDVYPYPQNYAFETNGIFNIDELIFQYKYSIPLHQYNNLTKCVV